jgi:SAM-dependent methyltransferase
MKNPPPMARTVSNSRFGRPLITGGELVAEQTQTQAKKCRNRRLAEYSSYISNMTSMGERTNNTYLKELHRRFKIPIIQTAIPSGADGKKRLVPFLTPRPHCFKFLFDYLGRRFPAEALDWFDVGCGHGLALREHKLLNPGTKIRHHGIDFVPMDWENLESQVEALAPGKERAQWSAILDQNLDTMAWGDATQLQFGPAHFISAIEVIQYVEDKLGAICHWFNQLKPGGVMLIATETDWSNWLRAPADKYGQSLPVEDLLKIVPYMAQFCSQERSGNISTLLLFKPQRCGQLTLQCQPESVWVNPYQEKATYYPVLPPGQQYVTIAETV